MADHLRLLPAEALPTRRLNRNYNPDAPPFDKNRQATTLRGILEGLESTHPGIFATAVAPDGAAPEIDAADLGEIVLKVTGKAPFANGAFKQWDMTPLAAAGEKQFFVLSDAVARYAFGELAGQYIQAPADVETTKAILTILENIDGVELYDVADRIAPGLSAPDDNLVADIDVILWPTSMAERGAVAEGERRVARIRELVESFSDEDPRVAVLAVDDRNTDTLMLHTRLNADAFTAVTGHPYVERVRGPLAVEVTISDLVQGAPPSMTILPEGAPIGIIDDLVVDANPWLTDVVVEQRHFPDQSSFGTHTRHGTQVAGIAAWGDVRKLLDPQFDGQPHPLYVARVAQMNDQFEAQIIGNTAQQISDALDWLASCDVRVVVLALGENHPDDGAIPSDLSAIVDQKAADHGLVIVTSAGNIRKIEGDWHKDYPAYLSNPNAKIAAPGSAALAVTVTSHSHSDSIDRSRWPTGVVIAKNGEIAPFARTGPSRGVNANGRQKPEFAAHGGSWALDQATGNVIHDDAHHAATTLIPPINGRLFGAAAGTSFAAPRVAHEIARIQSRYPDAGPNLLRALTALAGGRPPTGTLKPGRPVTGLYGIPDADRVLESDETRVVFVYEGEMDTSSHTVLELPIPEEYARGAAQRELRVALAFDPPTRRSRRDYIAGRMHFEFIQRESLEDIRNAYARQPSRQAAENAGLTIYPSLKGATLQPPKTRLSADTLICRTYWKPQAGWDPNDEEYFLVVTHERSPWSTTQQNAYPSQTFAVAVHLIDHERADMDLYALAQARLTARARARGLW